MRVAIYARYSDDKQNPRSTADQTRDCRELAARSGWTVTAEFADAAISGASLILRPGVQALVKGALAREFDVVLAEALDRFSRDQEDIAGLYKRLKFADARIVTLQEGEISPLHVGLKGTMNAIFLQDLAHKTRRGLRGRVESGRSAGGLCYGYRVLRGADGPLIGEREIDERQAAIVRRIFDEFIAGDSPRVIARRLNAERVPGPTAAPWSPSTIHGHVTRGTGLLNNELYVGRIVWNRLRYIKDPATGKRVSRLNPSTEWIVRDVPQLRIVADDVWQAVKVRQASTRRIIEKGIVRARRPQHLFSGLVVCGVCGGGFTAISNRRVGCFNARRRGACSSQRAIGRVEVEQRVLQAMADRFLEPKAFEALCRGYADAMEERRRELVAGQAGARREVTTVDRSIREILETVKAGYRTKALLDELVALEERKRLLEATLSAPMQAALHPSMAADFRKRILALRVALERGEQPEDAREMVRGLVNRIVVPEEGLLRLEGNLGALLEMAAGKKLPSIVNLDGSYVGCGGGI